jgi:prolyl oligopeptidase
MTAYFIRQRVITFQTSLLIICLALTSIIICGCSTSDSNEAGFKYPPARRVDIVDNFHGTQVADPYRWLEDANSDETVKWVESQNKLFFEYVNVPIREELKKRITELLNYPRYSAPGKEGPGYFYWKNDGLQDQDIYYLMESLTADPVIILNPNELSDDGTISVKEKAFTVDGSLMVYAISESGSDEEKLKIRKITTGEDFEETLINCRFTAVSWKHDNSGFYYDRYPDPADVAPDDLNNYNRVYFHNIGTPQSEDIIIFETPENKELGFSPHVTTDGNYLVLHVWHGTDTENRTYYRNLSNNSGFIRLLDNADAAYGFIDNIGTKFYFITNKNAPNYKIISIDIDSPDPANWREIVPEKSDALNKAIFVNNQIVIQYLHDAYSQVMIYDLNGNFVEEIELPALGTAYLHKARRTDKEFFFKFTSFLYPTGAFRYSFETEELTHFGETGNVFDPSGYETKQIFCTSKDGTKIPVFITHRKGMKLDSNNPTILYGYGGFNVNKTPSYSTTKALWMEYGGVYALAVLRGGTEYGEEWHKAGMLENKQNVYDDFIAAGEWLIDNKYTNSSRLAIQGGSNGGLLVAACELQRPDLFGAVMCHVPVTDMLRYHKFTVGRFWTGEYGNAEKYPDHFKFMYAYSPVHNVTPGKSYPPTLITTADTDDRVVPMHGKKFTAALQAADAGVYPILLRVDTKAGHGGGKPLSKRIEQYADEYAFLFKVFGMD